MIEDRHENTMNLSCSEFRANLENYWESEGTSRLRAHVKGCSACGALLGDLELIPSAAGSLPLEAPSPRVWSNIRASLASEGFFRERESFWKRWLVPARLSTSAVPVGALVLLIVFAIFLLSPGDLFRKAAPTSAPTAVATALVPPHLTAVEANLVQTVQQMEASYRAREASLDPVAKRTFGRGLGSLDSSIHECLVSLHEQPHNALARQYLMQAYTEKADVLAAALESYAR